MAEWFKALVLKTDVYVSIPWVRIPFYPSFKKLLKKLNVNSNRIIAFTRIL